MSNDPKDMSRSQGWRSDIVVVPVNRPLPPGPGIDWWLRRIMNQK